VATSCSLRADSETGLLGRLRALLPQGNTLPREVWLRRHRWLVLLLAAQGVGITIYALFRGFTVPHSCAEGGVLVAFAVAAWVTRDQQRLAAVLCSVGLVSTSALLVHVSGGLIEAHFHFFVMIVLLTLYEDWLPFLVAAAYVAFHHGVAGLADPASVYNHPDAIAHPLKWALIHALFVTAAGLAAVVAWRLNEEYRAQTESAFRSASASERSLTEAQELAQIGSFEWDLVDGAVEWSKGLYRVFGLDPEVFAPSYEAYVERIHADDRERVERGIGEAAESGGNFSHQYRYGHPDGSMRTLHARGEVLFGDNGEPEKLVGTCQDVTERQRAEVRAVQRAAEQEAVAELGKLALAGARIPALFREAVTTVSHVLDTDIVAVCELIADEEELVVLAQVGIDDAIGIRFPATRSGWASGHTLLTGEAVIVDDWARERRFEMPAFARRLGVRSSMTVLIKGRDRPFGVLGAFATEPAKFDADDANSLQAVANVLAAAIDRGQADDEIRHRALHDPLTGLPNRVLFVDRLEQALAHARRDGKRVGVLFCDLDQFKLVNDSLGHEAGDELLSAVAPRLAAVLRSSDTVARFGGDEFGILVEAIDDERDVTKAAERIARALVTPFVLRGREHFVTASIGIAIGDGAEPPESLIRDADAAMYRAKERGRGRYEIFDELMRSRALVHLRTENDLRRALERDELVVHYQPMISLATGEISGLEALVRWQHPERGLLAPGEFIGLAEESGLIVEVGDRVLQLACRQAVAWQGERPDAPPIGISVNISPRQLVDRTFCDRVSAVLRETDLQPVCLSLEVTETVLVDEFESPAANFERLKGLGVGLVLDDFGTGFSSLGYLQRFPFDLLKIDRSFVDRLGTDPANMAIVTAVTGIADALGLGVVAEGVETKAQLDVITALGCGYAQGFYLSRPLEPERVPELLSGPLPTRAPVYGPDAVRS
jgi:diguanylate cyclase (GGDEF)-like protein/PAS domain S-box-containing protein